MVVKRKRQVTEAKGKWTELRFERAGFKTKYETTTLVASKSGLAIYKTSLVGGQNVRLFKNASKIAIMADPRGIKKVKSNKQNTRVTISGKKVVNELKLKPGVALAGKLGEVDGKEAWIFE